MTQRDKTTPRLTSELIYETIIKEEYHVFDGTLTVCGLTLKNGSTVTGESDCVSPENYIPEIEREISKRNARDKIWSLEGYLRKQRIFENN